MVKDLTYREEIFRKIAHVGAGAVGIPVCLWVEHTYGMGAVKGLLLIALLGSLVFDYFRNELNLKLYLLPFLQRKREIKHLHAATLALIATLISLEFFQREVVIAALLMFFLGDAAAALVGKKFGRLRLGNKSLEGSMAMLIVCLAVGWSMLPFWPALAMAVAATFVELVVDVIDDSLVIILLSGFVGDILLRLLA
ncbi:MAG TPA: hypothetical protein VLJ21_03965 [Candidatus Binatia bacterium]|nr:hypothetical protein [Candidatus Binatia bacterium]